jgi:Protein of unknown function (DUF1592)/Protein of unknown function (DUF1588)/Protein of unknown function (DUF1587)/Protein of unknown function (DUF1585)/Protein of unknown function (DUF1595)/Planctomycete cytochrome C
MKIAGVIVVAAAAVAAGVYFMAHRGPESVLKEHWAMVDSYCIDCHNDAEFTGGLSFEGRNPGDVIADAEIWEKAIHKLNLGMMPPRDVDQPDREVVTQFVSALESTLDAAAQRHPYAGKTAVHRLNRAEYQNAIRDLLGVDADLAAMLPSDGGDFGFDNIAEVLTTSPMLLERYLTVALRVADMAVGNPDAIVTASTYGIPIEVTQDYHLDGMPLGTRGGVKVVHNFPADADYVFEGRLLRGVEEGLFGIEGHDIPHEFLVLVDDEVVYTTEIGGKDDHELSVEEGINVANTAIDEKLTSPRIPITAGPHEVAFTWKERREREQNAWEPGLRASLEIHNPSGMPRLEMGVVQGPYDVTGVSETPSREKIFVCRPDSAADEPACAEQILLKIARHAFRRPVTADDIAPAMAFYSDERASGGSFDQGIHSGLSRILVSPFFLFRVEKDASDVPQGSAAPIDEFELASRLSFFLWSSIPDDELLDLAEQGRLREPEVLEAQVQRMIADERSEALIENFTGQWLQLRNLDVRVKPDLKMFDDFDDNLRQAFRHETEMLFGNVLREGRPVHELLTADYTFVNERLARHYGIDGVYGARFRKVAVEDPNRQGLLGHGSLLSLTSVSSRTSPIIRGKFILAELLNNPPPAPPDNVPALEESAPKDRPSTVREQLELHRADPVCAACHTVIDPPGFALENFDAVGRWRETTREGLPIDSRGTLADGTEVDGPVALRQALVARPENFAGTVTEKMLIYALGRGLEPADMPVVRQIVRNSAEGGYRLDSIILGIVDSFPFQMRTNDSESSADVTVAQTRE